MGSQNSTSKYFCRCKLKCEFLKSLFKSRGQPKEMQVCQMTKLKFVNEQNPLDLTALPKEYMFLLKGKIGSKETSVLCEIWARDQFFKQIDISPGFSKSLTTLSTNIKISPFLNLSTFFDPLTQIPVSKQIAKRAYSTEINVVLDAFASPLSLILPKFFNHVIACDQELGKLAILKNLEAFKNVEMNIDLILADFETQPFNNIDIIVLNMPQLTTNKTETKRTVDTIFEVNFQKCFEKAYKITPNIAIIFPLSPSMAELPSLFEPQFDQWNKFNNQQQKINRIGLKASKGARYSFEIEYTRELQKIKKVIIYFGALCKVLEQLCNLQQITQEEEKDQIKNYLFTSFFQDEKTWPLFSKFVDIIANRINFPNLVKMVGSIENASNLIQSINEQLMQNFGFANDELENLIGKKELQMLNFDSTPGAQSFSTPVGLTEGKKDRESQLKIDDQSPVFLEKDIMQLRKGVSEQISNSGIWVKKSAELLEKKHSKDSSDDAVKIMEGSNIILGNQKRFYNNSALDSSFSFNFNSFCIEEKKDK